MKTAGQTQTQQLNSNSTQLNIPASFTGPVHYVQCCPLSAATYRHKHQHKHSNNISNTQQRPRTCSAYVYRAALNADFPPASPTPILPAILPFFPCIAESKGEGGGGREVGSAVVGWGAGGVEASEADELSTYVEVRARGCRQQYPLV